MPQLPDEAMVVRGGSNLPENFVRGSGVTVGTDGALQGVSVNAGVGLSVADLTAANPQTGYPGILNNQVGVTTVGAIRARGGDVEPSPSRANPNHSTFTGLTPKEARELLRPIVLNPSRRQP